MSSIDIYPLPCVKWITSGSCYVTNIEATSLVFCDDLGGRMGRRRRLKREDTHRHTHTVMTDSS